MIFKILRLVTNKTHITADNNCGVNFYAQKLRGEQKWITLMQTAVSTAQ